MKLRIIESIASDEFNAFYNAVIQFKEDRDKFNDIQIRKDGNIIEASGFDFMADNLIEFANKYLSSWDKEIRDPSRFGKQTSYGGTITITYTNDEYIIIINKI